MGIYLDLRIVPARIEQSEWKKVYEESLLLVQAYPFVRLKLEKFQGLPRLIYSSKVEEKNLDGASRNWMVCGDAQSKKTGEEFSLESDLSRYDSVINSNDRKNKKRDLLLVDFDDAEEDNENKKIEFKSIFSNKTQGYDYHKYVLAIAMLIESRFPEVALVSGDINLRQAEEAREWANQRLQHPIDLPVKVDSERLWQRLEKYYQGKKILLAFDHLYIRDFPSDTPKIFFRKAPSEDIKNWFRKRLYKYSSLTQLGAKELMIGWLNNSNDLETLCEIVLKQDLPEPHFTHEEFIKALTSTWIMIEPEQYMIFKFFSNPYGKSTSVINQFGNMSLDIFYAGWQIAVHWNKEDVVPLLMRYTGITVDKIEELIAEESEEQLERIKHFQQIFQPIKDKIDSIQSNEELLDDEDILLFFSETTEIKEALKSELLGFTRHAMTLLREEGGSFSKDSIEKMHEEIILLAYHLELSISEVGWQWIDAEKDLEVLRVLLTFLRIADSSNRFYRMRQAVLENRLLCHSLAGWLRECN